MPNWKPKFLEAFADVGMVGKACDIAGITRSTAYMHRQADEEFAQAWAETERRFLEALERTAWARAVDGSDRLIEFLLKSKMPDVYSERTRLQHSGSIDGPRTTVVTGFAPVDLSPALQKQIAEELEAKRTAELAQDAPSNGSGNGHA